MKRIRKRYKVECLICGSTFNNDYKRKHEELCHGGRNISVKLAGAPKNPFDAARKKIKTASSSELSLLTASMELTREIKLVQKLVSNVPKEREKALNKVRRFFQVKSFSDEAFTEDGMLKLWKGLFFYFWNCDKPLFQEERADLISKFIHAFKKTKYSFLYMDTFFQTMSREWFGIDRYRIEKFMMFVRKFLRECFELLKRSQWDLKSVKHFRRVMKKTVISPKSESAPLGLKIHICDIYMEELARAGSEQLTPEMVTWFLNPYLIVFWKCDDSSFLENVSKDVFLYLLNQDADEVEFHKFPVLKFDALEIQKLLLEYAAKPSIRKLNRSRMYDVIKEFITSLEYGKQLKDLQ